MLDAGGAGGGEVADETKAADDVGFIYIELADDAAKRDDRRKRTTAHQAQAKKKAHELPPDPWP